MASPPVSSTPGSRLVLTRVLGSAAGLVQGDTMTLDRWWWLSERLPMTANEERLLDVGCGSGAFTIRAAERGYNALGLTWDEPATRIATERAGIVGAQRASFRICDVRYLDQREELKNAFDVAICCENIEHIMDDRRLIRAIFGCLKPGGRLLLTSPNYYYRAIRGEIGPYSKVEDGGHVRRGYSKGSIQELVSGTGFILEDISYISGFFSQKATWFLRLFPGQARIVPWLITLPLRPFIPLADRVFHAFSRYPLYCIGFEAYKPRD